MDVELIPDCSFDRQFDEVTNLAWYPWVGKGYKEAEHRILIVGDSHYATDGGKFDSECYADFMSDKQSTRNIIKRNLRGEKWKFFVNLQQAFRQKDCMDERNIWPWIAFYNFIQRPMKKTDEKPCYSDYAAAWPCFIELIKIIKPTECVFIGVRSETCFGFSLENLGLTYSLEDMSEQINRTRPRNGFVAFPDGYSLRFLIIKHTSRGFSPAQWYDFLKRRLPDAMAWLNRH